MPERVTTIPNPITRDFFEQAIAGHVYKVEPYGKLSWRVSPNQRERFNQAMESGFLVAHGSETSLRMAFFLWGEMEQRPYILVKPRGESAGVEVDFICIERRLNNVGIARVQEVLKLYPPTQPQNVGVGSTFSFYKTLPLADAKRLAGEFSRIAANPDCTFSRKQSIENDEHERLGSLHA